MQQDITKTLQDLAKAIESSEAVESVTIKITLKKPKPSKVSSESK